MDELTLRGDLLDKVEFIPIPGQNWNPRLCGRQEDQRIIQAFLALIRLEALRPRECAGDHAGISPDLCVRFEQPDSWDVRK